MKYKHDCPICKYLGEFNGHNLYYCTEKHGLYHLSYGEFALIVRTSDTAFSAMSLSEMSRNESFSCMSPSEKEALRRYRIERTK